MHARRMGVAVVALCTLFVSVLLLPEAAAFEGIRPAKPRAEMAIGAGRVDWQPTGDYEHLTLTVAGPAGVWIRNEFAAGQPASLSLFDRNGNQLPDGAYIYELRLVPRKTGSLDRPLLQAGSFAVRDGRFATVFEDRRDSGEVSSATAPQVQNITAATEVIADDLVVQGGACIGALCGSTDVGPPLLLKDYWVGIIFEDVYDGLSYTRDWALVANPLVGGPDHFFFYDIDAGTTPFSVQGGAPDYSLVVGTSGNLGLGTSTPAQDIHAMSGNTPTLRLEQDGSSARTWDIGANHTELFVKDVTNSSSVPFRILAGAPTDSLRVSSTGQVGIGTSSPSTQLHVRDTGSGGKILAENASGTTAAREMLEIKNNGGTAFILKDTTVSERWSMSTYSSSLILNNQANAGIEYTFNPTGNLTIAGTLTQGSDRDSKRDITAIQPQEILAKVANLPITTWNRKTDPPAVRHLGPMAQDFATAFGLGDDDRHIAVLDIAGVSLASIQALNQKVTEKEAEIAELRRENDSLAQRLAALEALVLRGGTAPATDMAPAP